MSRGPEHPGLYVHLPFCSTLCPYCDFYVLTGDSHRRQRYIHHLLQEISLCKQAPWPCFVDPVPQRPFDTLYFGGGTPSILKPEDLLALGGAIRKCLPVATDPWIGLEANPEDITPQNLAAWKELGIRFLSLGVQSFDERSLRFLGRAHRPQDCRRSGALARLAGLETLSLDLIYGLPHQTPADWQADLESALELAPDHLSCYQLTVEPRTSFGFRQQRGELPELAPERQADLFFLTHDFLGEHGFAAYEISNFATAPHHRSRHNSKYWRHAPYLGLGPSAHSFAPNQRWWNVRKIKPYEAQIDAGQRPIEQRELLTSDQVWLERLMVGLRTPAGIDFGEFADGAGPRIWHTNQILIHELEAADLLTIEERRLVPTLAGLAVAEGMACRFVLLDP